MAHKEQRVRWETASGEPVTAEGVTLTPVSRALTLRWPRGGLVWNRPLGLDVERGGELARIPIVDVTRVAQLALFGLSMLFALAGLVAWISGGRGSDG